MYFADKLDTNIEIVFFLLIHMTQKTGLTLIDVKIIIY